MSTRLQIVMNENELEGLRTIADARGLTLSEWARQALREAARRSDVGDSATKLRALRKASAHSFPVGDIDEMLREIAAGYES